MNIIIRSTSFLLNGNPLWDKLPKNTKIDFSNYNDLFSNIKKKSFDFEILLIFSRDILDQFSINQKNQKNRLNKIIKAIESRAKLNKDTIECLHEWAHGTFWNIKWTNDFEDFA